MGLTISLPINYTQVFFRWPQINQASIYNLYLSGSEEEAQFESSKNSILINDLSWGNQYTWEVCAEDSFGSIIDCYDNLFFTINNLPNYYPNNLNVVVQDEDNMAPGITLMDFESLNFSVAINKYGEALWYADRTNFYNNKIIASQFLKSGNVVGFGAGRGYEFNLNSDLLFETPDNVGVHHYIYKTNHGTYFLIDSIIENHPCPDECDPNLPDLIPWQGDNFIELDQNGNIVWEWSTFDYLDLNEYNPHLVEIYTGQNEFDWTHSNAVYFDEQLNSVFVSIRNLSRITAIDYSTKEVLWNLGAPEFMDEIFFEDYFGFSHQHSSQLTPSDNLIFFDNGRNNNPEVSRCMEVDFNSSENAELVWEYVLPDSMLTLSRGECDRLMNNNTLITAGRTGNVIEIDENNEIVWHINVKDNQGASVSIYRSQRILDLYPNIFSFEIENISGEYNEYVFEDNSGELSFTVYNLGWSDQLYQYEISNSNSTVLLSGEVSMLANSTLNILNDISSFEVGNYSLKVFEINTPQNFQIITFYKDEILGDLNYDNTIDVLDVVLLVNFVLNSLEFNEVADLNNDDINNVLDIVLIVNLILNQ